MKNLNYKEEILKIIITNGGCFTGFNKLKKIGNFHTTTLQNHLLEMEKQNLITINKSKLGRTPTEYCQIIPHYGIILKLEDRYIKKIEKLKKLDLTPKDRLMLGSNLVKIAFNKYKNIILGELSSKFVDDYPAVPYDLKNAKRHYLSIIKNELVELNESDRRRILNSLYEESSEKEIWKYIQKLY